MLTGPGSRLPSAMSAAVCAVRKSAASSRSSECAYPTCAPRMARTPTPVTEPDWALLILPSSSETAVEVARST